MRLRQGDFEAETIYDDDPVAVARRFATAGAQWLHVVDLDAARTGERVNVGVVEAICASVPAAVQTGGGVRSAEAAGALLAAGAARVIVGTAAVRRPELVAELSTLHPGRVAVGLDARDSATVAVEGWTESGNAGLHELAARVEDSGAAALVVTAITRDGMLAGPDLELLSGVLEATRVPLIASGGVGALADIRAVRDLRVGHRRPAGVVVGTALYEGRFTVEDALATGADRDE